MIQHVLNYITNRTLYLLVGIMIGISACQTFWYSNPIVPSIIKDSSVINTCKPISFEQNIVGTWHFQQRTNKITKGTVTFNMDKTIFDPDSLFKIPSNKAKISKEVYSYEALTMPPLDSYGKLFIIRPYSGSSFSLGFQFYKLKTNECNHILFGEPDGGDIELELTR